MNDRRDQSAAREGAAANVGGSGRYVDIVTRELRQQIVSGQRQAGTRLTEMSIAEEFGISRVPVREALRILEGEGFVTAKSPRVRVVASVDDTDAGDLFDVRSTVETLTAARAAEHATEEQREFLNAIVQEGQERLLRGDLEALPGLNARLHATIASAAGSPMLLGLVNQIMPKVTWYYTAVVGERALSSWREHAELANVIVAGDADEARHRMREHVAGTRFAYLNRDRQQAATEDAVGEADSTGRSAGPATIGGGHHRDHAVWRVRPASVPLLRGSRGGPLAGIRVAVKDLYALRGHAIGAGNPVFLSRAGRQEATAPSVQALVEAGADIVGIAQCDELGFSIAGANEHYGVPLNPRAPGHLVGGSSSGPAAAVALEQADLGLGTDTAGSIRVPASYTGLYGLRTTHGSIDMSGVVPLAPSFDTVGLLARDPELLNRAVEIVAPNSASESITRLLLVPGLMRRLPHHVLRAVRDATESLAKFLGAELEVVQISEEVVRTWYAAFRTVQHAEAWACHGAFIEANRGALAPQIEERFLTGRSLEELQVAAARETVASASATVRSWLAPATAVALPATSGPAPRGDTPNEEFGFTRQMTLELTFLFSMAGLPALTAPLAEIGTLPLGITLATVPDHDRALVDLARRLDSVQGKAS